LSRGRTSRVEHVRRAKKKKEELMNAFFLEGGFAMYPILVMGLILVAASARYALDGEPVRLRFIAALGTAHVVTTLFGSWLAVAAVLRYMQTVPAAEFQKTLVVGFTESTRPGLLGGALLVLALIAVAIGAYRAGRRELRALRGE